MADSTQPAERDLEDLIREAATGAEPNNALHQLGEHAIGALMAARELDDPVIIDLAERLAVEVGNEIARRLRAQ